LHLVGLYETSISRCTVRRIWKMFNLNAWYSFLVLWSPGFKHWPATGNSFSGFGCPFEIHPFCNTHSSHAATCLDVLRCHRLRGLPLNYILNLQINTEYQDVIFMCFTLQTHYYFKIYFLKMIIFNVDYWTNWIQN